jgi:hypothetical protein
MNARPGNGAGNGTGRAAITGIRLDDELVDAFCNGTLDRQGEAVLAEQVARVLPFHSALPSPTAAALSRVIDRLGNEQALFAWLESHPGLPRLTASVYALIGLLDTLSDQPAVVGALREARQQIGLPASLEAHLVPDPLAPDAGSETLASVAGQIESLLAEERLADAVQMARATAEMLQYVVSRAAEADPNLQDLSGQLDRIRHSLNTLDVPG